MPIDPFPAVSAHAVFPQSGRMLPEKTAVFQQISTFFQIRTDEKINKRNTEEAV